MDFKTRTQLLLSWVGNTEGMMGCSTETSSQVIAVPGNNHQPLLQQRAVEIVKFPFTLTTLMVAMNYTCWHWSCAHEIVTRDHLAMSLVKWRLKFVHKLHIQKGFSPAWWLAKSVYSANQVRIWQMGTSSSTDRLNAQTHIYLTHRPLPVIMMKGSVRHLWSVSPYISWSHATHQLVQV